MSNRRIEIHLPEWWPPSVGDKLRGVWGPTDISEDPLYHVVAVFEHDQNSCGPQIVLTRWWPSNQRWHYSVHHAYEGVVGSLRPNGRPRLDKW